MRRRQVRTPHRFELTLSEPLIIGKRRAAQRMVATAREALAAAAGAGAGVGGPPGEEAVLAALERALGSLHAGSPKAKQ